MPPLLGPSPNLIDQAFPRSTDELCAISKALTRIVEGLENEEFKFLLTNPLRSFIRDLDVTFDWSKMAEFPQLQSIYNILASFGLQQAGIETADLSVVTGHLPHPVPSGIDECFATEIWVDEMGRLLLVHEEARRGKGEPFVGICCTSAFSGGALGAYQCKQGTPLLPLVGPLEMAALSDSEEWDVRPEWKNRTVTFEEAKTNIKYLGGRVSKPRGSSHYEVEFVGQRTWPLDENYREVPEDYIKELIPITKLELHVIKFVLCQGRIPPKRSRLARTLQSWGSADTI